MFLFNTSNRYLLNKKTKLLRIACDFKLKNNKIIPQLNICHDAILTCSFEASAASEIENLLLKKIVAQMLADLAMKKWEYS